MGFRGKVPVGFRGNAALEFRVKALSGTLMQGITLYLSIPIAFLSA